MVICELCSNPHPTSHHLIEAMNEMRRPTTDPATLREEQQTQVVRLLQSVVT